MLRSSVIAGLMIGTCLVSSEAAAGSQTGLLQGVATIDYDINGRIVSALVVNFASGTPYEGSTPPGCVPAPQGIPDWVFDLSTENGREAASSVRLAIALGRPVKIGSRGTCSLVGPNSEDGNLVVLFGS